MAAVPNFIHTMNNIILFLLWLQPFTFHASGFTSRRIGSILSRHIRSEDAFVKDERHLFLSSHMNPKDPLNESSKRSHGTGFYSSSLSAANNKLVQILQQCNFDERLVSIHKSELPIVGELYAGGSWKLCIITAFKSPNSMKAMASQSDSDILFNGQIVSPLLEVLTIDPGCDYREIAIRKERETVVDLGQITTIWKFPIQDDVIVYANYLSNIMREAELSLTRDFPVSYGEEVMQSLYETRIRATNTGPSNRNRNGNKLKKSPKHKQLTKKDIGRIAASVSDNDAYQSHVHQLLRKAVKVGIGGGEKNRLVDSLVAASLLFQGKGKGASKEKSKTQMLLTGASLLAMDADLGGRFKRSPCMFVSGHYKSAIDKNGENIVVADGATLINGGWVAVDESVRAGAEARKFAERSNAKATANANGSLNSSEKRTSQIFTAADERIMYRLECLAMGEELGSNRDEKELELDVREALSALELEKSPEGAQQALVKTGRWSPMQKEEIQAGRKGIQKLYNPWSSEILDCARALQKAESERRLQLFQKCSQNKTRKRLADGREDLTALPALCIDAKRASFRDDALGVRPRSSTGRRVKKGCKWELLVHIADVSDVYSPDLPKESFNLDLSPLRQAAENRGTSRYDLPLGPLHLMPPVALEALALDTKRDGKKSKESSVNRCVTVWAYINEKTGKILDAGLERTAIQKPCALSFEEATELLGCDDEYLSTSEKQTKTLLSIIERILSSWKETRLENSEAARKREKRLQVREMVANEVMDSGSMRDDGAKGSFQRTRGHRIVDNALDLHGSTLSTLLLRSKAPIPRASGSGMDRGGRLGTAPLRRYIDGVAQRQALSVLCAYGGQPMTKKECSAANEIATKAINNINNLKSSKKSSKDPMNNNNAVRKQMKALRALESHFVSRNINGKNRIVPALSTGNSNEVVISGIGIMAKCKGVRGTLRSGERISVVVTKIDPKKGLIQVRLADQKGGKIR